MRGLLFLALCCVVLHGISGCARPAPLEDAPFVIAFESAPGTLDPRFGVDAYSSRVRSLVFSSLLELAGDGNYRPYAAREWHCDFLKLECRFSLRRGLTFHDGSVLDAHDVAATYAAILAPGSGSPKKAQLEGITRVEAVDDETVRFSLSHASPTIPEAATLGLLPAELAARPRLSLDEIVGSGPYAIDGYDSEERIRLRAFPEFHRGAPSINSLEVRVVPDALMRAMELRHGTVDLVQNAIDPDTVEWLEENAPELQVIRAPSSNFQYLGMNFDNRVLADVRVRRAIAHALDLEIIADHLLGRAAKRASGLLPPEHWAYYGNIARYDYDPQRAIALLEEAGYHDPDGDGPRPRLRFSYKTTTHELRRRIAEALKDQLGAVGIELDVRTYEWGTFFADVRSGNFDLYTLEWVGIVDPDIYRQIFHSAMIPPAGNNRGRYRDDVMDRLTDAGLAELQPTRRSAIYAEVQQRAAEQLPYVPLWWPERVVVAARDLEGFVPHPSGTLLGLAAAHQRKR